MPELAEGQNFAQTGGEHLIEPSNIQNEDTPASLHEESDPLSQASDDGWGKAQEAYFKDGVLEEYDEEPVEVDNPQETVGDGESEQQTAEDQETQPDEQEVESGELDIKYNLDDLQVPHKFKPRVEQKLKAILDDVKSKSSELNQGYKESNAALGRAFVNVLQSDNPLATLRDYAEQVAPAIGLPQELLSKFSEKAQGSPEPAPQNADQGTAQGLDVGNIQQRLGQELGRIEEKYWPLLEKEQDPQKARELFSRMERDKLSLVNAVNSAQLKAVLQGFYSKLIKPQFDEFSTLKGEAEHNKAVAEHKAKVSLWNDADKQMKDKFADWPQYRAQVKKLLKGEYAASKERASNTGQGHLKLMQDLYLLASRNSHLAAAKKPQRGDSGLKTTGKHIPTKRAGGSDWDSIKQEHWGDLLDDDD